MNVTLRKAASTLRAGLPGARADLYIGNRKGEMIYAVSELIADQGSAYSPDILYVTDWSSMLRLLPDRLPPNLLCTGADERQVPLPRRSNIILTDAEPSVAEITALLDSSVAKSQTHLRFSSEILDILEASDLNSACEMAASILGNPILVLGADFLPAAQYMPRTGNETITGLCKSNDALFRFLKSLRNELGGARTLKSSVMLTLREYDMRIITESLLQNEIDVGKIIVFEDHVKFDEAADRGFVEHLAKIFQFIMQRDTPNPGQRLTKEYALVKCLSAVGTSMHTRARLMAAGYALKEHFFVIVVDSALISTPDLARHLKSLHARLSSIFESYGITAIYKDQVVTLVNLDGPSLPAAVVSGLGTLLENNQQLRIGVSQHFTDIDTIHLYYRQSLDTIGVGRIMRPGRALLFFDDARIYMLINNCARIRDPMSFIHPAVKQLIAYDRQYHTDYLRVLYLYLSMLKKTKETAEKLHIHRNTLLYRLEKIQDIAQFDLDDGETVLELMLSYRILEYDARNKNSPVCFLLPEDEEPG